QTRVADVPFAVDLRDQKPRVRASGNTVQTELVRALQAGEQCPVLGLGRAAGTDRLGVLGETHPRLVVEEIANRRRSRRASGPAVHVQHRETGPRRRYGTGRPGIRLRDRAALGVLGGASFAPGSPTTVWLAGKIAHWSSAERTTVKRRT